MKKQLLLLLCLEVSAYGQSLYGGSEAPEGAYPYQAALRLNSEFVCGASIINRHWLLTAAHCVKVLLKNPRRARVRLGTNCLSGRRGEEYRVAEVVDHEDYDVDYIHANDIGLVRLLKEINFTTTIQPVELPKGPYESYEGATAILSGWGRLGPRRKVPAKLQHVKLRVIPLGQCAEEWALERNRTVTKSQLCTIGALEERMVTPGDSGGPLVVNGVQVGIVSFAFDGLPDVHTRVSHYLPWINSYANL